MKREKEVESLKYIIRKLQDSGSSIEEIFGLVHSSLRKEENKTDDLIIPVSIFSKTFGALESIVVFFKENKQLSFDQIGSVLNRSKVVVSNTYRKARKKSKKKIIGKKTSITIPLSILSNRTSSPQRLIVKYLHNEYKLTFSEIGRILCRDPRTIWTAYHAKKGGKK